MDEDADVRNQFSMLMTEEEWLIVDMVAAYRKIGRVYAEMMLCLPERERFSFVAVERI